MKKVFFDGVHGLRAIAALQVVIFHAGSIISSEKYQGLNSIQTYTRSLIAGVDLFFVISGFVISLTIFSGRFTPIHSYLANRFLRIYPMAMITALVFLIFNWSIFGRVPSFDSIISSFLLLPSATDPIPIVLWTLKQELLFYIFFGLCFVNRAAGLTFVFIWAIASALCQKSDSFILSWLLHPNNIQFGFGIAAAYMYTFHKIEPAKSTWIACLGFVLFVITSIFAAADSIGVTLGIVLLGLFGLLTIYGLACAEITLPRAIIFLGTASYSIYLIHYFFISALNKLMVWLVPDLPGALSVVILTVFATLMGCAYYVVFERPIERWRRSGKSKEP